MTRPGFRDLLEARWDRGHCLCVGLDPEAGRLPPHLRHEAGGSDAAATLAFCTSIVRATHEVACAFKPNAAFFEALGPDGATVLAELTRRIREIAPEVPVIYDAKRGDIGSTNAGYVASAFNDLGADAITVHPYLGREALAPFLDRADKGVIVLCRTSNPGAGEFQDLDIGGRALYEIVAERVAGGWNQNRNCGLVVGATYPDELARVRRLAGDLPILIPGIGAQGGDLGRTVTAGQDARGRGMIISASRGIIYASAQADFADAARHEAMRLDREINRYRTAGR